MRLMSEIPHKQEISFCSSLPQSSCYNLFICQLSLCKNMLRLTPLHPLAHEGHFKTAVTSHQNQIGSWSKIRTEHQHLQCERSLKAHSYCTFETDTETDGALCIDFVCVLLHSLDDLYYGRKGAIQPEVVEGQQ